MVIACVESADSIARCLDSIADSCKGIETEFIVVSAGDDPSVAQIVASHGGALVTLDADALVPRLWAEGIARSTGSVVALTISECSASAKWATGLVTAIESGAAAVGGPIALHPAASTVDAAIFFLRYSAFLPGRSPSTTVGVAGDNSAYSRETLDSGGWSREGGFWEVEVIDRLRDRGKRIEWVPEATMEFRGAGLLSTMARRRYAHGRLFGMTRTLDHGESSLRIVLASPVVPFVLFVRALRRVWPNRSYRRRILAAMPAFALLSLSWAMGEAVGAIGAGRANRY